MTGGGSSGSEQFDPEPILAVLERHGVDYVLVGGFAARMHGSIRPTRDVDVTPATTRANLDRLAAALRELGARIRTEGVPEGLAFSTSAEALVGQRMPNLQTSHGELDLTIRPAAFEGGYDDLAPRAVRRSVGDVQVRVAALDDVIRSKEAAGRRKDQEALPELYQLAGRTAEPAPPPIPTPISRRSPRTRRLGSPRHGPRPGAGRIAAIRGDSDPLIFALVVRGGLPRRRVGRERPGAPSRFSHDAGQSVEHEGAGDCNVRAGVPEDQRHPVQRHDRIAVISPNSMAMTATVDCGRRISSTAVERTALTRRAAGQSRCRGSRLPAPALLPRTRGAARLSPAAAILVGDGAVFRSAHPTEPFGPRCAWRRLRRRQGPPAAGCAGWSPGPSGSSA